MSYVTSAPMPLTLRRGEEFRWQIGPKVITTFLWAVYSAAQSPARRRPRSARARRQCSPKLHGWHEWMYCAESTRLAPHRSHEAMPRRKSPGPVTSIQQQLTDAANAFAAGILRVLGTSTLTNLTALTDRQAAPEPSGKPQQDIDSVEPQRRKPTSPRTLNLRRLAGTKPVICPVPGCETAGVRSKMNFCKEHAASLSQAERVRLRQQQRVGHRTEKVDEGDAIKGGKKRRRKEE